MDSKLKNFYKQFSGSGRVVLSADAKQRVKNRVFQRLAEQPAEIDPSLSWWTRLRHSFLLKSYILVPLVVLLFVISTAAASAYSLPGEVLYSVKRQVENARVILASTAEAKLELEFNFAEERLTELERLQAYGNAQSEQKDQANTPTTEDGKDNFNGKDKQKDNTNNNSGASKARRPASQGEVRARQQAEGALDFLEKTREQYKDPKDNQRAEDLNKRIQDYRKRLFEENQDESSNNGVDNFLRGGQGSVKGATDINVRVDAGSISGSRGSK
jgi:hypothetical protein